eukprot:Platyproteum_vivax@DN6422_c0_g1_i4.p2
MLIGSCFILNFTPGVEAFSIQPYCLATCNRMEAQDHLRVVKVPDVSPGDFLKPGLDFSMCAGEFVEVYANQKNSFDAILTCFFIDTAKNIFLYIRTIADVIRPGGLWANLGPLLFHYAEMAQEMSIELSWAEIKKVIGKWFTIKEERMVDTNYTTNEKSLMQVVFHSIFFAAIRNDVPTTGSSNPVFPVSDECAGPDCQES